MNYSMLLFVCAFFFSRFLKQTLILNIFKYTSLKIIYIKKLCIKTNPTKSHMYIFYLKKYTNKKERKEDLFMNF